MISDLKITQLAKDSLFRATVRKENKAREDFQKNYGYLIGPLIDIIKDEIPKLIDKSRPKTEEILPPQLLEEGLKLSGKALPSPTPYPKTSSAIIGWRSSCEYWLDKKCPKK